MQSDFAESIEAALESSGVDAPRLTVEITEGALMHDVDGAWATLRQVKALGVKLTLDDFGTGHSSLGYLRTFRLDNLKIDRSFVNGLHNSREEEAIVQQIIGLAHALGMRAMAEGVERADQAEVLRSLGCDAAQGYYYSTPQPADVIDGLLTKSRLDPSDRPTTLDEVVQTSSRGTLVRPELD
jgi:EAL domain-containing protein (putative c-di-GMP-specific phosphodiesterase class I)